jgi:endonuclease YncB( thermonuclease family)
MKQLLATLLITVCLLPTTTVAKKQPNGVLHDIVITRIIDGDTVGIQANWLLAPLKPELSVRVYGVDTPEKSWRGQCQREKDLGEQASNFTTEQIKNSKRHQMLLFSWDKFGGRVLADIILDGKSLREMLITKGYAREYYGDAKISWCE